MLPRLFVASVSLASASGRVYRGVYRDSSLQFAAKHWPEKG
jgi:hypothetical protein